MREEVSVCVWECAQLLSLQLTREAPLGNNPESWHMPAWSRHEGEPVPWNLQGHEVYMNLRTGAYFLSEV